MSTITVHFSNALLISQVLEVDFPWQWCSASYVTVDAKAMAQKINKLLTLDNYLVTDEATGQVKMPRSGIQLDNCKTAAEAWWFLKYSEDLQEETFKKNYNQALEQTLNLLRQYIY